MNFATGKAELTPESQAILDGVAESLVANEEIKVQVGGHTDNTGSAAVNKRLSAARARDGARVPGLEGRGGRPADRTGVRPEQAGRVEQDGGRTGAEPPGGADEAQLAPRGARPDGDDGEEGEDGEEQRGWSVCSLSVLSVLSVVSVLLMSGLPIVDPGALARLDQLGGPGFALRIIVIFRSEGPRRLADARAALDRRDGQELSHAVHALISSAGNVGAAALEELVREMERDAEQARWDVLPAQVTRLEAMLVAVNTRLDEWQAATG